jgi:hypothetical protein
MCVGGDCEQTLFFIIYQQDLRRENRQKIYCIVICCLIYWYLFRILWVFSHFNNKNSKAIIQHVKLIFSRGYRPVGRMCGIDIKIYQNFAKTTVCMKIVQTCSVPLYDIDQGFWKRVGSIEECQGRNLLSAQEQCPLLPRTCMNGNLEK